MKPSSILIPAVTVLAVLAGGCDRGGNASVDGIVQTGYPGQVTAGGQSSGAIIAATARPVTNAVYAGGTPGHAGGAGGTSSGAETAGTVRETGEGPSRGVTPPTGVQPGTKSTSGDNATPAAPAPGTVRSMPASNAGAQGPAAPGQLKGQQ